MGIKRNIIIKDIDYFSSFLSTLIKFVPSCQFIVDKNSTKVNALNDAHTIRAFFETNSVVTDSEEELNFCLNDVSKLLKAINLIKGNDTKESITLQYDETFITYDGTTCFKFKVIKEKIIEQYITKPITALLATVFKFKTSVAKIKQVIQANSIVSQEESKVYMYMKENKVIAEIDDKQNAFNDSIGLPIADAILEGHLGKVTCIKFSDFILFSILPAEDIFIKLTDKNVFEIEANIIKGDYKVSMRMLAQILKI